MATVSTEITYKEYLVQTDGETLFAYNFLIYNAAHWEVYVNDLLRTDYTVTGAGDPNGGLLTFLPSALLHAGDRIIMKRTTPQTQLVDFVDHDFNLANTLEDAFTKHTLMVQDLREMLGRAPLLPPYTRTAYRHKALPINPRMRLLGYDAAGDFTTYPITEAPSFSQFDHLGNYGNSLALAVAEIGASRRSLYILAPTTVPETVTVPRNITLHIQAEGAVEVLAGAVLSVASPVQAGPYPWMSGAGVFALAGNAAVEWWGVTSAVGFTASENSDALQRAIIEHAGRGELRFNGDYTFACQFPGARYVQGTADLGTIYQTKLCAEVRGGLRMNLQGHEMQIESDGVLVNHQAWLGGSETTPYHDIHISNGYLTKGASIFGAGIGSFGFAFFNNNRVTIDSIHMKNIGFSKLVRADGCHNGRMTGFMNATLRAGLGLFGHCRYWVIDTMSVTWDNPVGDEVLDLNRQVFNFQIGFLTLVTAEGAHLQEILDMNSVQNVQIAGISGVGSINTGVGITSKDCDGTWEEYLERLDNVSNPLNHAYQPTNDIQITQLLMNGPGDGGPAHLRIGNTPSAHGPNSLVQRVQIDELLSVNASDAGLQIQEGKDIQINKCQIISPGTHGVVIQSDPLEANSVSTAIVQIGELIIRDCPRIGLLVTDMEQIQINNLLISNCNTNNESNSDIRFSRMNTRGGDIVLGNVYLQAGAFAFRGLDVQENDATTSLQISDLKIVGSYSDNKVKAVSHVGIYNKTAAWNLLATPGAATIVTVSDPDFADANAVDLVTATAVTTMAAGATVNDIWDLRIFDRQSMILRARLVIPVGIAGDNTNYVVFQLQRRRAGVAEEIGSARSRLDELGTITANIPFAITDAQIVADNDKYFVPDDVLFLNKGSAGTGLAVPKVCVTVDYLEY